MKTCIMPDPLRYSRMTTAELRQTFLIDSLFTPNEIAMVYCDVDRTIVGSAVPTSKALTLGTADQLRAAYFLERRELGILNIGEKGSVTVDGVAYEMDNLDCLYVGRGNKELLFTSADPATPAQFYLLSYPAHTNYPTTLAKKAQAAAVKLGAEATANKRTIYKYIHADGIKSCQLVMGFTQLEAGSIWNTMPAHTHMRRSEIYLYFNIPADHRVMHFMGPADETRHLVMASNQVAISPSWSIHSGAGTSSYTFCWGMGGENQAFDDMDHLPVTATQVIRTRIFNHRDTKALSFLGYKSLSEFDATLQELDRIGKEIVDAAFKVHSALGPGLLESVYEACLFYELTKRGLKVRRQVRLPIQYDNLLLESALELDLLVEDKIIIELKAVEKMIPLFNAQLLSHLKLAKLHLGYLINFNSTLIKDGIKRMVL